MQQRRAQGQPLPERPPGDVLHHEIGAALGLAEVVDVDDVEVAEAGEEFGFLLKAGAEAFLLGEFGANVDDSWFGAINHPRLCHHPCHSRRCVGSA
jgi:hypothetical protein